MVDKRITTLSLCHLLLHTDCLSAKTRWTPPTGPSQCCGVKGVPIISLGVSMGLEMETK